MTVEELKKAIEAHAVGDGVYVLSGDSFLAEQYAEAIVGDAWYPAPGLSRAREEALGSDGLWAVVRQGRRVLVRHRGRRGIEGRRRVP